MIIGNQTFDTKNNFYIMGIVNVTPDSFSDGGKFNEKDKALFHIEEMVRNGVDILDIGGESTRPNYEKVPAQEEIDRVLPVLSAIKERFDTPISLDTHKSQVAQAAMPYIDMVNDVWGLTLDDVMGKIIAEQGKSCCIMHNRDNVDYTNFFEDVVSDVKKSLTIAEKAGIPKDRIMIDAGVGFAKNYQQNLTAIHQTQPFSTLGYPVLMAVSNKGVIGTATDALVDDRLSGTLATTVFGALNGASFFRVHDVKANKQALSMVKAILNQGKG